ncbi:Histidinol-phosphate aminotransferase [compost metagenome]
MLAIDSIRQILDNNPDSVVIIDEAYIDFGGTSAVELISEYNNLLVIHTFSKSRSLAGLRVGLALGQSELIEGLNRVKNCFNSYTLDRVALAGAEQSLRDIDTFKTNVNRIIQTREQITSKLRNLGFNVVDSKANFIFISHSGAPAEIIFKKLKQRHIYVRYFKKPGIDNYLRVSIGTDQEMNEFYKGVKEILEDSTWLSDTPFSGEIG